MVRLCTSWKGPACSFAIIGTKFFLAFRPTTVDVYKVCIEGCVLRVGKLLGIVVIPRYV